MSSELSFRFATSDDIPEIVDVVESAYRGEASKAGWTTEADLLGGTRTDAAGVHELVDAEDSHILLASRAESLLCCCHVQRQGEHGYFGLFAVRPTEQGSGIGKLVLAEAERIARQRWSIREMHMKVLIQREDLIAWYERRGYARTGQHSPFPYGQSRFGIPRRDDLAFETLAKQF